MAKNIHTCTVALPMYLGIGVKIGPKLERNDTHSFQETELSLINIENV